jgi:4'-phosphopantetheinyl transferase
MPVIFQKEWPSGRRMVLWRMDELPEMLFSKLELRAVEKAVWQTFHHSKRQREWIGFRTVLKELDIKEIIKYLANGKPVISDTLHLSPSHCLPLIGVLCGPESVGLDIQDPLPKLHVIRKKYAHPEELQAAIDSDSELDYLTLLWSAKEAVFKVYGEELTFASEIRVRPFKLSDRKLTVDLRKPGMERIHELEFMWLENCWVTWTLD